MSGFAKRRSGLTLIEMTVVIGAIVILVGFGLPAVRTLVRSFESTGSAKSMIAAALNSARAMAVKDQRYTGIRFQMRCLSGDSGNPIDKVLEAPQYMIFIVHGEFAEMGDLANGFKAMEGVEPIKLPQTIGVIDLSQASAANYDDLNELNNALTFSVVFSPSGKLTVHSVRVRNRDGVPTPPNQGRDSADETFNSALNIIENGQGVFVQDDYPQYGFEEEPSRTQFALFDRQRLRSVFTDVKQNVWDDYLSTLTGEDLVYVSPHTGRLISSD